MENETMKKLQSVIADLSASELRENKTQNPNMGKLSAKSFSNSENI